MFKSRIYLKVKNFDKLKQGFHLFSGMEKSPGRLSYSIGRLLHEPETA
ncbi:MAG: hypothetical protein JW731_00625 [Bacteroidales bacterium]|nr:hypothetical protein [Bacteroidales bacterium]